MPFSPTLETYGVVVLVFARIYTFINFLPLVGGDEVPGMVKTIFCASLTPFLASPLLVQGVSYEITAPFYLLLIKELLVGALMSLIVSLPLRIPELIGDVIDNQRGAAVTDSFNPTSGEQSSMLGQLLSLTIMTYFLSEGGLNQLVNLLGNSFTLTPVGNMDFLHFGNKRLYDSLVGMFVSYIGLFSILALPVMVAMFMAEISLAIASRFAQSLNVFSMAQPIKAVIAIAMMIPLLVKINSAIMEALHVTMKMFGDV
jgi:type III secretion protein T